MLLTGECPRNWERPIIYLIIKDLRIRKSYYEVLQNNSMVPRVGLEPTRCHHHRILNPARLPIPPPRHTGGHYNKEIDSHNGFWYIILKKDN